MQVFNGKATVNQLAQNWGISYFGNMIGTLIIITLMSLGGVFPYQASGVLKMALPKVGLTFTQVTPFDEKPGSIPGSPIQAVNLIAQGWVACSLTCLYL